MPPPPPPPLSTSNIPHGLRAPNPLSSEMPFGTSDGPSNTPPSPPHSDLELSTVPSAYHPTTPIRATPLSLVSPPLSSEHHRPVAPPLFNPRLQFELPPLISPLSPPFLIQDLTPDTLTALCISGTETKIQCDLEEFLEWKKHNELLLEDFWGRWEYDVGTFIIKCMPTPVHESFTGYACEQITSTIRAVTGKSATQVGVQVLLNTNVPIRGPFKFSTIIPDLSTKVRLHPQHPQRYKHSIVVEVGFSQKPHLLRKRAHMWLYDAKPQQVHLVILIDLQEISQSYTDSRTGKNVAKSTAQRKQYDWSMDIFEGRSFEAQLTTQILGDDNTEREQEGGSADIEEVLMEMKNQLKDWLLEQDEKGELIPALVEPIDGYMYAYCRLAENEAEGQNAVNDITTNQQHEGDEINPRDPIDTESDEDHDDNTNNLENTENNPAPASPITLSEPEDMHGLDLRFSAQFISSSIPTPASATSCSELSLAIAELFGPLPTTPIASNPNQSTSIPLPSST